MRNVISILSICGCLFLFGCPANEEPTPVNEDRLSVTKTIFIDFYRDSIQLECKKQFIWKDVTFYSPGPGCAYRSYGIRIPDRNSFEIDFSKLRNISVVRLGIKHINPFWGEVRSKVKVYDNLNNAIFEAFTQRDFSYVTIENKWGDNLKKIIITGAAEVTDINDMWISGKQ